MKFDTKKILNKAEDDFEKAWAETPKLLEDQNSVFDQLSDLEGESHPVYELIQKLREEFMSLGFNEVIIPVMLEEDHVRRQYGPEAAVILDRCYYLAGLPRPDIGLGEDKLEKIKQIRPDFSHADGLKKVLRDYKKGEIEGDDFIEALCDLGFSPEQATRVLEEVFPEFRELNPVPSSMTLRSHMTSAWFPVLSSLKNRPMPLALFTAGLRFRREQKEDEGHLRAHHGASCVIMSPEVSLEDGKRLVRELLTPLGFEDFKFVTKRATSKYYTPGMEVEAYAKLGDEWLEIADFGLYNPIALANYGIEYPVLNLGIGIERIGMILYEVSDIRVLEYPHLSELELSDAQIASMISFVEKPRTELGREVSEAVREGAKKHMGEPGLCSFPVWEGEVDGEKMVVEVFEPEEGVSLMHEGGLNQVWVSDGGVYGLPEEGFEDLKQEGVNTEISYLDGVANLVGARVERGERFEFQVGMVKGLSDVNLEISKSAWHYITANNKKIDVRGPFFLDVRVE